MRVTSVPGTEAASLARGRGTACRPTTAAAGWHAPSWSAGPAGSPRFEADIRSAGHWAGEQGASAVRLAASALEEAKRELEDVLAGARDAREQRLWVGTAAVLGLAAGSVLWLLAAAVLPWGMGNWLAATLVGGGRWEAGQTLMREADPTAWNRMARLYNACPRNSSTDLCEAAMVVRTIPPVGQPLATPEETRAAPPAGPPPTQSRGKAGR